MKGQTKTQNQSLSKAELISSMADLSGLSKANSTRALNAMTHSIQTELSQGNEIHLLGFGTFCVTKRKARDGRNPRTGETIKLPSTTLPKFKVGKNLKEAIA